MTSEVGAGAYGSVYYGRWASRRVAIKKFNVNRNQTQQLSAIQKEVDLLERLRCRHIIQFYGTAYHEDKLVLVMDYADGGSLEDVINGRTLDWPTKTRIYQEIAGGLAYIHHENILHRDLKSANVLLTKHLEVKLADFGLALVKSTSSSNSAADTLKGTLRWMAPELFAKKPQYSTKSDMYALGMVMWEMAANSTKPFVDQLDNFTVVALVRDGEREELPEDTPPAYRALVERCWDQDPSKRPTADEMIDDEPVVARAPSQAGSGTTLELSDSVIGLSISSVLTTDTYVVEGAVKQPNSIEALRRAAEDGDVEAQFTLATKYEKGDGVEASLYDAFVWYQRAAAQDHTESQWKVGEQFYLGQGTKQNLDDAMIWFRKAADKGHAEAQFRVGWMLSDEDEPELDYAQAVSWFKKATEQGHAGAHCQLGLLYQRGQGVQRSYGDAMMHFYEGAMLDHPAGYNGVGFMYHHGLGVGRDYNKALEWYNKALEHNSSDAQYNVGQLYEKGLGVPKDLSKAKELYGKAAKQWHVDAMDRLEELKTPQTSRSFIRKFFG
ncbi:hypothetical protein BGZ73_005296 [Actinomortierella ambigua]|nr:hypothetical protein BGZ73_005296 [Actinomortierella ambigua]